MAAAKTLVNRPSFQVNMTQKMNHEIVIPNGSYTFSGLGTDSNRSHEPLILMSLKSRDIQKDIYSRSGAKSIHYGVRHLMILLKNSFNFGGGVSILEVRGWWAEGDK